MAEYQVTGPDGKKYRVTGPEGASKEQVLSKVRERMSRQQPSPDPQRQMNVPQSEQPAARQPDMLQRTGRSIRSAAEGANEVAGQAYDWMTGDVPREDLPELGSLKDASTGEKLKMALGYLSSSDPQQMADIAKDTLPGAKTRTDDQGNIVVRYKDKDYYINRPGASGADASQIVGEVLSYLPAAKWASLARRLPRRVMRAFTGEAATSGARDVTAAALGSDQGVNLGRAMMSGLTAGAFEPLSPVVARALPGILRNRRFVNEQTGELTNRGRKAARTAGIDPDMMDERLRQTFGRRARDAGPSDLPAQARVAQGERFDIPLTRGEAYKDNNLLALERRLESTTEDPGQMMRDFRTQQREAIERAGDETQGRLSQSRAPVGEAAPQVQSVEEAAGNVRDRMAQEAEAMRGSIDNAYDRARSYQATVAPSALEGLPQRVDSALRDIDIDPELTKAATRARELVRETVEESTETGGKSLRELETLRRKLGNQIGKAQNPTDRMAAARIKNALDEQIDEAFDRALFSGDSGALNALKEARDLRASYTRQFGDPGSKNRIDKLIGQIATDNPNAKDVVNWTFGWSGLGNKREAAKIMQRIRNSIGSDSPEWAQMREAGFFRLLRNSAGEAKTPKQMKTVFQKELQRNKELLDTLYTGDEQRMMRQYIDTANLAEALPEKLGNPSQSAFAVMDMLRRGTSYGQSSARIHGNFGLGMLFSQMRRVLPSGYTKKQARQVTSPLPVPQPRAPVVTAAGASTGAQNEEEVRRIRDELLRGTQNGAQNLYGYGRDLLSE